MNSNRRVAPLGGGKGVASSREPIDVVVVLVAILAVLAVIGYRFGVDDHFDLVPLVRRAASPGVLAGDWYVDAASATSVRSGFAVLMGALSGAVGEWPAFLAVSLATVALLVAGVQWVAAGLGFRREAVAIATVLAVVGSAGAIGLTSVLDPLLLPQTMAWTGLLWALGSVTRGRFAVAAILIGIVALVHPQLAVGGGAVIAVWSLLGGAPRPTIREAAVAAVIVAVVGGVSLVPAVLDVLARSSVDRSTEVEIVARLRNPWHMDPFAFSRYEWIGLAATLAVGLYTIRDAAFAPLRRLVAVVLAACALGTIGLIASVPFLVDLQLFRLTALIPISVAIIVGDRVASLVAMSATAADRATRLALGLVAIALVPIAASPPWPGLILSLGLVPLLAVGGLLQRSPERRGALVAAISVASVALIAALGVAVVRADLRVIVGSALVGLALVASRSRRRPALPRAVRTRVTVAAGSAAGLAILVAMACGLIGRPGFASAILGPLAAQAEPQDDLDRLAQWAASGIPAGALVLAPPGEPGWRFWSGHPEVVDFKSFPYSAESLVEWLRRIEDVSGTRFSITYAGVTEASTALDAAYRARGLVALGAVARAYDARYLVVPAPLAAACDVVHAQGDWALIETGAACTSP